MPRAALAWLKAVAAPLAGLRFCPTGGIGDRNRAGLSGAANVACVGGSWVAPRDAVAAGDWSRIEHFAPQRPRSNVPSARHGNCFK